MDCCRRGCPLNKSTNKNANVNIFSHNFFLLEWVMKISHYIDRQQREQLTTYTVNEKHFLHAWFCHLHKEWYETFLGVRASQRTKENLEILSPSVSVTPHLILLQVLKILGILSGRGRVSTLTEGTCSTYLQRVVGMKNNTFSSCIKSLCATEK